MENWAYAGSKENIANDIKPVKECKPETYSEYTNQTQYASFRAMGLLVETSGEKKPISTKLGFDESFEALNQSVFDRNHSFYGHIIRNMRIIWGTADLMSPYFYINHSGLNISNNTLYFNGLLSGCQTVESVTQYQMSIEKKQNFTFELFSNIPSLLNYSTIVNEFNQTKCYWGINSPSNQTTLAEQYQLNYSLSVNSTFFAPQTFTSKTKQKFPKMLITYLKASSPDKAYASQQSSGLPIHSQTHMVSHKSNSSYSIINQNYHLAQANHFYSNPIAIIEDGSVFEVDQPEALFYTENDFTLSYSVYSTNEGFSFNRTKVIPLAHLVPSSKRNISRASELTFNVSIGILISTSDYGNNEIKMFIEKGDPFLLFYSSNEEIDAEIMLDEDTEEEKPIKITCTLYMTIFKKYYCLCDNMFENTTIGNHMTVEVLRDKVLNSHIKLDIEHLNMTLYTTFTLINSNYFGKGSDIMSRGNSLICPSNPSLHYQIDHFIEKNLSTHNLTQLYYDNNLTNYNIRMKKLSNYHYLVSLEVLNNETFNVSSTIALVFPLNGLFIAGNYSSLQNANLYLNKSLTNTRLLGKGVYIISLGKEFAPEFLNATFLRQIITHKSIKEYQMTVCSIDKEERKSKKSLQVFYNTHTQRIPKPSAKFMIAIGLVSTGSIIFVVIAICVILCLIQRYRRRGYSTVSTKKEIESEQL